MQRYVTAALASALLSLLAGGCASTGLGDGYFGEAAFHSATLPAAVTYVDPAERRLLSEEWILDNYQRDEEGRPSESKQGPEYESTLEFDTDGDGKVDLRQDVPAYDLRFENRRTDAVLWMRAVVVEPRDADKELRVMAQRYLDSVADSGETVVEVSQGTIRIEQSERHAVRVLSRVPATLRGREAIAVTFDVADVPPGQVTDHARWRRGKVVIVRVDDTVRVAEERYPVMLVMGYSNLPDDFDRNLDALHALLDHVEIVDGRRRLALLEPDMRSCAGRKDPSDGAEGLTVEVSTTGEADFDGMRFAPPNTRACLKDLLERFDFGPPDEPIALTLDLAAPPTEVAPLEGAGYVEETPQPAEAPATPVEGDGGVEL